MRRMRAGWLIATILATVLPAGASLSQRAAAAGSAATNTKTVTRDQTLPDGTVTTLDSRTVSLSVSTTQNLKGLQQIDVSWTGARPTGGGVSDPNDGTKAVGLEYPMVLLECRGVDSASAPPNQQLSPQTCWTAYFQQERSLFVSVTPSPTIPGSTWPWWRLDMYAPAAQRQSAVGIPDPATSGSPAGCGAGGNVYWQPFQAANGAMFYPGPEPPCLYPPEAAGASGSDVLSFPSNETYGSTGPDGNGKARFDVFTANENASLGCSDSVPCSLVAVPVMGISCDLADLGVPPAERPSSTQTVEPIDGGAPLTELAEADQNCAATGSLLSGQGTAPPSEVAVSGAMWWAASNWRNRITVPLSFAPVQNPCAAAAVGRQEVDIYGSELMAQAAAQWDPHFCADPSLFVLKHIQTAEGTARTTVAQHNSEAAYATYAPTGTYDSPVVSAPVALTGFAIGFSIDGDNGREVTSLNLNARLLAKLLTESYPNDNKFVQLNDTGCVSDPVGANSLPYPTKTAVDPKKITPPCAMGVLSKNPLNMYQDLEFQALNPGLVQEGFGTHTSSDRLGAEIDGASTLYALSTNADVMYALSSYIINDPEAKAWLYGAPDPWGMVVNPAYNLSYPRLQLPTEEWPLLDQYLSPYGEDTYQGKIACPPLSQTPWLDLVAAPQQSMAIISQDVEFAQPPSVSNCKLITDPATSVQVGVLTKDARMPIGERFVLGVVSLGEAKEFGLRTAALQTQIAPGTPAGQFPPASHRTFVNPTNASLAAAAALLVPDPKTGTFQLPGTAFASTAAGQGAYPGTMLVNAQVPVTGLPPTDAANIAKFLQFAAGPGQTPGTGYGQLPDGYLPMTAANGMGALVAYTQAAAGAVAAQSGVVPPLPGQPAGGPGGGGGGGGGRGGGGGTTTVTPSPSSSTATATTPGSRGSGGSGSLGTSAAFGPRLGSGIGSGNNVPSPQGAPPPGGLAAVVGKTLGILSGVTGSLLSWLTYIALLALLLAAGLYLVFGRHRWEGFGTGAFGASVREIVLGAFARRRGP